MKRRVALVLLSVIFLFPLLMPNADNKSYAVEHDPELWKVVNPLKTTTSFLNTGAHPDDERSNLLAYLSLGNGVRTGSLIANRGEGGQNQIGLELGNGLGIIRSEELIEASAVTNVDLIILSEDLSDSIYDFGFSKSPDETLEEWDEEIVYERLIRKIREYRPEIVFPSFLNVDSQHGHHRAINVLTLKAYEDAANPDIFPEHLEEGITPWQIKKMYLPAQTVSDQTVSIEVGNEIDEVYGKTYAQLGEDSRYLHKSQGMGRDLPVEPIYVNLELVKSESDIPEQEETIFDGLDLNFEDTAKSLNRKDNQVRGSLLKVQKALNKVVDQYPSRADTFKETHKALAEVSKTIEKIEKSKIDTTLKEDLLFKLRIKNEQLSKVSQVSSELAVTVEVNNPTLTKGGETAVNVTARNNGDVTIQDVFLELNAPENWHVSNPGKKKNLRPGEQISVNFTVEVPENATYFHPYEKSMITGRATYKHQNESASFVVEPTTTVAVLPDVSVDLNPDQLAINQLDVPETVEVEMVLTNYVNGSAEAIPSLELPEGWSASTSQEVVYFEEQGETQNVTFTITPGTEIPEAFDVAGVVEVDNERFSTTIQPISYDHIRKQYYPYEAVSKGISFELTIPEGLKVGYIDSGFDQMADYLKDIGMDITKLSNEEIASGDLSQYDSIVLGIRAYRKEGLPGLNSKLMEYVEQGGHVVAQYHTPNDSFDGAVHPPYPITIGTPSIRWRVTDQNAEVTVQNPEHPLFDYPNEIEEADWNNWVQERALYFPSAWDDRYETFISMADPGEEPFTSGILMADYGEGTYMYTNLVWYRQIQGQVSGGYRIFTNLISYPLQK
ncbi:NEW3 domain-containing protein [Sutcliffiella horikoshii]|uniref:NEW3 domain-containing protein n=1 Tax=Sutcliffiella horikoshii TaxID=79883 RepID=UPI0038510D08